MYPAYEIPGILISFPANVDMSNEATYLYTPVNVFAASATGIDTGTAIAPVNASGDPAIGILQTNPQPAEAGTVMVTGVSQALLAGTVSIGNLLQANPTGGLSVCQSGNQAIAQALQAGLAGQIIAVLLVARGKQ